MCTAFSMTSKNHYFGRNLDLDRSYNEEVCIMPKKFPMNFRKKGDVNSHYALIGMATVVNEVPLFYDASNEYGLSMAGLNFPGNAYFFEEKENKDNITPFEFIPWILGQCKSVKEAKVLLNKINLVNISFSENLPLSPLHWIIDDNDESIVVESRKEGIFIHQNTVRVLTNNPPFEYQMDNLKNYEHLRNDNKEIDIVDSPFYTSYSLGLGGVGLPGDFSSMSRFVRCVFNLKNSICEKDELSCVGQFFHILASVSVVQGSCIADNGACHITKYSACTNTQKGLYYYTTYKNQQITCVNMHSIDLNSDKITRFSLKTKENILYDN